MEKYKIETLKFFKNNLIKILLGMVLITILYVGLSYNNFKRNIAINIDNLEKNEDSSNPIDFHVKKNKANFYFYVENDNSTSFTNNYLIEQYITSPEVLEQAASITSTVLDEIVEYTENRILHDDIDIGETKVIGIRRNDTSGIFEFHVNVDNEEDNLKIANYFYEYIVTKEIPILENKYIYIYQEPKIKELSQVSNFDYETELTKNKTYNLYKDIMIGVIFGSVVIIGSLLVFSFTTKRINYVFTYYVGEADYFFLVDEKINYKEELTKILNNLSLEEHIIIRENNTIGSKNKDFINIFNRIKNENTFKENRSFLDLLEVGNVKRITYILEEGTTSREWYNRERKIAEPYNIPTSIIQVNKT